MLPAPHRSVVQEEGHSRQRMSELAAADSASVNRVTAWLELCAVGREV